MLQHKNALNCDGCYCCAHTFGFSYTVKVIKVKSTLFFSDIFRHFSCDSGFARSFKTFNLNLSFPFRMFLLLFKESFLATRATLKLVTADPCAMKFSFLWRHLLTDFQVEDLSTSTIYQMVCGYNSILLSDMCLNFSS